MICVFEIRFSVFTNLTLLAYFTYFTNLYFIVSFLYHSLKFAAVQYKRTDNRGNVPSVGRWN